MKRAVPPLLLFTALLIAVPDGRPSGPGAKLEPFSGKLDHEVAAEASREANRPRDYCWLERLPGTSEDSVARLIAFECSKVSSLPWFKPSYRDWRTCVIERASGTASPFAVAAIRLACIELFGG